MTHTLPTTPPTGERDRPIRTMLVAATATLTLCACGQASEPDTAMKAEDIPENQGTRQGANGNVGVGGPIVRQSPEPTGNPAGAQGHPATGLP